MVRRRTAGAWVAVAAAAALLTGCSQEDVQRLEDCRTLAEANARAVAELQGVLEAVQQAGSDPQAAADRATEALRSTAEDLRAAAEDIQADDLRRAEQAAADALERLAQGGVENAAQEVNEALGAVAQPAASCVGG